ncbi:hypothetical protein PUN28_002275 [Cardiocondyla obscurior]|uniref:Phospholipase A2 n=1 Tax=Cardiocondyla obscurior TaxID=286306 RepID=A0AAW2GTI3_9HYME
MTPTIVLLSVLLLASRNIRGWHISFPNNTGIGSNELRDTTYESALIFPGTKWCGSGNVADGPDDLGIFAMTDACCREHDNCKDVIEPMETKHGLVNSAFYTRLHCSCDERFYDCLHSTEELVSAKVGFLYFSVLDTKCFREDHPILDESQPKMYQWFDVPTYFQNDHRSIPMTGRHIRSLGSGTSFADR